MIAIPAIDLREGACVQLVGGSYAEERVRLPDPVAAARKWIAAGFRELHVVDLDAATDVDGNRRSNAKAIARLLALHDAAFQVGGGVRTTGRMDELFRLGAARVVVGTRALEDPAWLAEQAARWPRRIVLAMDVSGGKPAVRGWSRTLDLELEPLLRDATALPLAAVLVTAVDVEGRLQGCDLELVSRVVAASHVPVIASGGVTTVDDLRALADRGAWGAVIGMALYTGIMDAEDVAAEFGGVWMEGAGR
jgi:phosphoribosylformimino-5-aminoimidazole carboxamide ribotide isomerase